MKQLIGKIILLGLLLILFYFFVWAWQVNDRISRCFDDYDPAYIDDDASRQAACGE